MCFTQEQRTYREIRFFERLLYQGTCTGCSIWICRLITSIYASYNTVTESYLCFLDVELMLSVLYQKLFSATGTRFRCV